MPKLTAAQIENRRHSIYIKNLTLKTDTKQSDETDQTRLFIKNTLKSFGEITQVSVDGLKKTAIVRFKDIATAENTYKHSREIDDETGKRRSILGTLHPES